MELWKKLVVVVVGSVWVVLMLLIVFGCVVASLGGSWGSHRLPTRAEFGWTDSSKLGDIISEQRRTNQLLMEIKQELQKQRGGTQ